MADAVRLYYVCGRCNGAGYVQNDGLTEDPCALCSGSKYVKSRLAIALDSDGEVQEEDVTAFTDVFGDISDKLDDILDKCNDIFEQVTE